MGSSRQLSNIGHAAYHNTHTEFDISPHNRFYSFWYHWLIPFKGGLGQMFLYLQHLSLLGILPDSRI